MPEINFSQLANFQPKQLEAWNALFDPQCKYLLMGGAAFGGKSYWLRWSILSYILYLTQKYHRTGIEGGLFSEDYPTLKDRQVSRIAREFPSWLGHLADHKEYGLSYLIGEKYGGGIIKLRNLDDPSKYASSEFAVEAVEELTKNPVDTFEDLRFRLRWPGIDEVKFMAATNPGEVGHMWVKDKWIDKDPRKLDPERDRFYFVQSLPTDNKFLAPGYLEQLKALPESKRKRFLEGSWNLITGQVFWEFTEKYHVIPSFIPKSSFTHILSMDWGYSEKSAAAVYASVIIEMKTPSGEKFNRVITYQEWYDNQINPEKWGEILYTTARQKKFEAMYCDPNMFSPGTDGSVDIADKIKKRMNTLHGKPWVPLKKANNDRDAGWAVMHDWLSLAPDGLPYWMVTKDCPNLIRTLPSLVYNKNLMERHKEDLDTTQEDHAADALRYGLVHIKFISVKPGAYTYGKVELAQRKFNEQNQELAISPKEFSSQFPTQQEVYARIRQQTASSSRLRAS